MSPRKPRKPQPAPKPETAEPSPSSPDSTSLPPPVPPPADLTGDLVLRHAVQAHCVIALLPDEAAELGPTATQVLIERIEELLITCVVQAKDHVFNLEMVGSVWIAGQPLTMPARPETPPAPGATA